MRSKIMNLQEQFILDVDRYVIQAETTLKRKLNRQRKENVARIEKVEKKIKNVKFKDSEYSIKLELIEKMKAYVEKYAYLPHSYRNMLIRWSN